MSVWTDDRVELLEKLWGEGVICRKIAEQLGDGFTRNSILGKARRLGLPAHIVLPGNYYPHVRQSAPRKKQEDIAPEGFLGVPLLDLAWVDGAPAECRYPQGEGPFTFCGQKVRRHSSYCPAHHQICYGHPMPAKRTNFVRWGITA